MQIYPHSLATDKYLSCGHFMSHTHLALGQREGPIRPLSRNLNHGGPTCTRTNELVLHQETSMKMDSIIALFSTIFL